MAANAAVNVWSQYLRRIASYGCMVFGICNPRVVYENEAAKIPEDDWLKLYSHMNRTYGLARTGSYLTTASMLVMMGRNDQDIIANSGLNTKKDITSPFGCRIADSPFGAKVKDQLAGEIREGKTILVTELPYTGSRPSHHHTTSVLVWVTWDGTLMCSRS